MNKATLILCFLLFALIALFPAGVFISACFGCTFELISISAFSIIIAILSICIVVFSPVSKETTKCKTIHILMAILAPISLINAVLYIFVCPKIWVVACVFVAAGCCCYFTVKYGKPLVLKITALVLSAIIALPAVPFSFIALFFGNLGQNTVVQTVESPNGKYYAQVIDSDQGALGGDTTVNVYQHAGINAVIFKIEKMPQEVYFGDWGEFEYMQIYWKDDRHLVINSVVYEIE